MNTIAICADDFGLSKGVSTAIIQLIKNKKISATSCMTVCPSWPLAAQELSEVAADVDVGLHLTLTDQKPLGIMPSLAPEGCFPSLRHLIFLSLTKRLAAEEMKAEIHRQIDAFETHMGRPPDFVDGHHHVHQLPGIQDAVINVVKERLNKRGFFIRCCWESPARIISRRIHITRALFVATPGWLLRKRLLKDGIAFNQGFSGVHSFTSGVDFYYLMEKFITAQKNGGLIMCHPGFPDPELQKVDSVTKWRRHEFETLNSVKLEGFLKNQKLILGRLSKTLNK